MAAACGGIGGAEEKQKTDKAIKLITLPTRLPFLLNETFGPGNAKGVDINKWVTILKFEIASHVDADEKSVSTENHISSEFFGEAKITLSLHELASVEKFSEERWKALGEKVSPLLQQLNDRDGKPGIYTYAKQPIYEAKPAGFSWRVFLDHQNQIKVKISDEVRQSVLEDKKAREAGIQLAVCLDGKLGHESKGGVAKINAHAASCAAYSPAPKAPDIKIEMNERSANFDWSGGKGSNSTGNSGGIGISYARWNKG